MDIHAYPYITTINEKDAMNQKRAKRGIWQGLEGGKERGI